MSESKKPRSWTLLLTGKVNGCVSKVGDKFAGSPEYYERVDVVEVLQQEIEPSACARCGGLVYDPVLLQSHVGYLYQHDETGRTTFREELDKDIGPRWHPTPLFAHSPVQHTVIRATDKDGYP